MSGMTAIDQQPAPVTQAAQDAEHLRLLRIGFLVWGGISVLFALFPLIHVTIGTALLAGALGGQGEGEPALVGLLFVAVGGMLSLMFGLIAAAELYAARCLRERRRRTFCLIAAGVACLGFPVGTALGIFTIIVLTRPTVVMLFDRPH